MGECAIELPRANNEIIRIGPCMFLQQQKYLIQLVTEAEIMDAIKDMPTDKAPRMDGLPIEFFTKNWNAINKIYLQMSKTASLQGDSSPPP